MSSGSGISPADGRVPHRFEDARESPHEGSWGYGRAARELGDVQEGERVEEREWVNDGVVDYSGWKQHDTASSTNRHCTDYLLLLQRHSTTRTSPTANELTAHPTQTPNTRTGLKSPGNWNWNCLLPSSTPGFQLRAHTPE